jgi:hypothetical protein
MKLSACNGKLALIFTTETRLSQVALMIKKGDEVVIEYEGKLLTITATESGFQASEKKMTE